jgi:aminopeptidase N
MMRKQNPIVSLFFVGAILMTALMSHESQAFHGVLTQAEAQSRAKQISQLQYRLSFVLPEKDPTYQGKVQATFQISPEASQVSASLFMEFAGGTINSIELNGKKVEYQYEKQLRIVFKTKDFQVGSNSLTIEFTHAYQNKGFGFHRTQDQADGKFYVYSDFEPYNANQAFPVFDQPDLKAQYELSVDAPSEWTVIANARESHIATLNEHTRRWTFPQGKPFSCYLFALMAGPYHQWESRTKSKVSLRLFARQSMAQYLEKDAQSWFEITDQGFQYFEKAFGYAYPFQKYDQILTPDYNQGAMENVGAVTFTEQYIFRTPPTPILVLRRAETIIHELAHMWFGNLVTMKWWDDLWLNESFATYVSNLAMSHFQDKIGPASVWQQFHSSDKMWAYQEDDYVTTHPIVGVAADTDTAIANFDGITYGKGASVLKQLVHFLGEETFLRGLKAYFKKYAFGNATRTDFIQTLAEAAQENLTSWELEWLKTSGTNAVKVEYSSKNGVIDTMVLHQYPDEADKKLRSHQTKIGLYDLNDQGKIVLREILNVRYSGAKTKIDAASGKKNPLFVFPNVDDHDFVHVILDTASLNSLESSLESMQDPLLKQMLWSTLWTMVRHAQLPAQTFIKWCITHLKNEQDLGVFQQALDYMITAFWYLDQNLKRKYQEPTEAFVFSLFEKTDPKNPMKIVLFTRYLNVLRSQAGLKRAETWLQQKEIAGFPFDQERRWSILFRLAHEGIPSARKKITAELTADKNDKGRLWAMAAEASIPEIKNKKLWWKRLLQEDPHYETLSIEKARRIMSVFHPEDRLEITEFMEDDFFKKLPSIVEKFPDKFNASFAKLMYPKHCSEKLDQKVSAFLKKHLHLPIGVLRELRMNQQLHQRTLQARQLSRSHERLKKHD